MSQLSKKKKMQFSIKKIVILKNIIELTWTKAQADFILWTAVHKHETLTIEIWWYSIKSFDPKKLTESLNCHAVPLYLKSWCSELS